VVYIGSLPPELCRSVLGASTFCGLGCERVLVSSKAASSETAITAKRPIQDVAPLTLTGDVPDL
jgi:hypothetical protein